MHRNVGTMRKGSASSGRLRTMGSERKSHRMPGRAPSKKSFSRGREWTITGGRAKRDCVLSWTVSGAMMECSLLTCVLEMEPEEREGFARLQSLVEDNDFHAGDLPLDIEMVNLGDILDSSERIDLSHGGRRISFFGAGYRGRFRGRQR